MAGFAQNAVPDGVYLTIGRRDRIVGQHQINSAGRL